MKENVAFWIWLFSITAHLVCAFVWAYRWGKQRGTIEGMDMANKIWERHTQWVIDNIQKYKEYPLK